MNSLDLNGLNIHAPYSVWKAGRQAYGFKTEFGVLYRIIFIDDQTIWESGAYELVILNENGKASPNDKNVRGTILAIIEEFFRCNPHILLYQCETGDNRQAVRERLFLHWFNNYDKEGRYVIRVSEIVAEGISNYAAVIVQRSNPQLSKILCDFDNFVGFISQKPKEP